MYRKMYNACPVKAAEYLPSLLLSNETCISIHVSVPVNINREQYETHLNPLT